MSRRHILPRWNKAELYTGRYSFLPPRSPKLNGFVERFNGTCRYELYNRQESLENMGDSRKIVSDYESFYNTYRPHQGLKQLTPYGNLVQKFPDKGRLSLLSHMY